MASDAPTLQPLADMSVHKLGTLEAIQTSVAKPAAQNGEFDDS
jgi:hypothetical protein